MLTRALCRDSSAQITRVRRIHYTSHDDKRLLFVARFFFRHSVSHAHTSHVHAVVLSFFPSCVTLVLVALGLHRSHRRKRDRKKAASFRARNCNRVVVGTISRLGRSWQRAYTWHVSILQWATSAAEVFKSPAKDIPLKVVLGCNDWVGIIDVAFILSVYAMRIGTNIRYTIYIHYIIDWSHHSSTTFKSILKTFDVPIVTFYCILWQ